MGKIHRDIKPENFIIINNEVKLADYGLCINSFSGGSRTGS